MKDSMGLKILVIILVLLLMCGLVFFAIINGIVDTVVNFIKTLGRKTFRSWKSNMAGN